ncbi:MAG: aminomethyltransferase family protein, partial [Pseudomonadota bacterium]
PNNDGKITEKWSFRRSNYFDFVGEEVKNVTENAGILDMTAFAKMEVTGPGARDWLNYVFANSVPKTAGRIALCHLLTPAGGVRSEFTVYEWAPGRFYLVSAGAFELHDHDTLRRHLPDDGSVELTPITGKYGVLVLAGPKSRDILSKVTHADLSNQAFKWLSAKEIDVGLCRAHALRVNFVGELGWELHHPMEMQTQIFDTLMEAGAGHGLKPFGIRAMDAMRLEKSYRLIPREMSIEYSAYESALDRFIKMDKPFVGRDGLAQWEKNGRDWAFVTLEVSGVTDADARGSEVILKDGEMIGRATSGGYGFRVGKSLAMAMVKPEFAAEGTTMDIVILGEKRQASVVSESPFDPTNERLRA